MQISNLQALFLEDYIYNDILGKIKLLKISDLLISHDFELLYNQMMISIQITKELYGIDNEKFSDIDLFFAKDENGKLIHFKDGLVFEEEFCLKEAFMNLLSMSFDVSIDKIKSVDEFHIFIVIDDDDVEKIISSENYEEFRSIILKTNKKNKLELSKSVEQKYKNPDIKSRFDIYKKHRKKNKKRNMIHFIDMVVLLLSKIGYDKKKTISNMTIFEFLCYYEWMMGEELYKSNYAQYLAGANSKDLDLTHWSRKIKF